MISAKYALILVLIIPMLSLRAEDDSENRAQRVLVIQNINKLKENLSLGKLSPGEFEKQFQEIESRAEGAGYRKEDIERFNKDAKEFVKSSTKLKPESIPVSPKTPKFETEEPLKSDVSSDKATREYFIKKLEEQSKNLNYSEVERGLLTPDLARQHTAAILELIRLIKDPNLFDLPELINKYKPYILATANGYYDLYVVKYEESRKLPRGFYPPSVKKDFLKDSNDFIDNIRKVKDYQFLANMLTDPAFRMQHGAKLFFKNTSKYENSLLEERSRERAFLISKHGIGNTSNKEASSFLEFIKNNKLISVILALLILTGIAIAIRKRNK